MIVPNPSEIKKILIVMMGGIGNMIFLTPALKALRRTYPAAEITFLGFWWSDERVTRMKEAGCQDFVRDLKEILDLIEKK